MLNSPGTTWQAFSRSRKGMLCGPGALLSAQVLTAMAISCVLTVGQSSVGPGEIGGAGGVSGG